MEDTFTCTHCGETVSLSQEYMVNDERICEACALDLTFICDCCGHRFYDEDDYGDDSLSLCANCRDNYYTHCAECDRLISMDYAHENPRDSYEYLCGTCYDEISDGLYEIHDYGYKPIPIFYGEGKRFFGVELEIDDGGRDDDNAEKILNIANGNAEHVYIKSDSSLEDGLEIVSHPMTLNYHLSNMPWREVMNEALRFGYYSHKTSTCGLHIHCNRNAFGGDVQEQDAVISRILFFIESHWAEMLKFSRRTEIQLNKWAARYGYKDKPNEILETAKKGSCGRYACVNIMNHATIEFRIFRGTLKYNTFAATLQLVNEICNVAFFMSDQELAALSWSDFVRELEPGKCSELITYLKERQLYVNEPIKTEEDD